MQEAGDPQHQAFPAGTCHQSLHRTNTRARNGLTPGMVLSNPKSTWPAPATPATSPQTAPGLTTEIFGRFPSRDRQRRPPQAAQGAFLASLRNCSRTVDSLMQPALPACPLPSPAPALRATRLSQRSRTRDLLGPPKTGDRSPTGCWCGSE